MPICRYEVFFPAEHSMGSKMKTRILFIGIPNLRDASCFRLSKNQLGKRILDERDHFYYQPDHYCRFPLSHVQEKEKAIATW